jgi:hypothetical protein
VTSLLLSDFDKISQISQSQNGRISFLKKKEIASFAFKEEEALIRQSTKRHKKACLLLLLRIILLGRGRERKRGGWAREICGTWS